MVLRKGTKRHKPESEEKSFSPEHRQEMIRQIVNLCEPLCESGGMELIHIEYQPESSGRTLRIFIDKPGGVTLEDCAQISRQLSDLLDVYIEESGAYRLEVSSPGFDRPLGKASDFDKFHGKQAKIRIINPIEGRKNFNGILEGLSGDLVRLRLDNETVSIPFDNILKARLVNTNES